MLVKRALKTLGSLLFAGVTASLVVACAGGGGVSNSTPKKELHGEVFYLNRMALPDGARVIVSLEDVSLADAPSTTLALEEIIIDGRQAPIPFVLKYDPTKVKAGHSYAVRATIRMQDKLLYTTTERFSVKLDGTDKQPVQVKVEPISRPN